MTVYQQEMTIKLIKIGMSIIFLLIATTIATTTTPINKYVNNKLVVYFIINYLSKSNVKMTEFLLL